MIRFAAAPALLSGDDLKAWRMAAGWKRLASPYSARYWSMVASSRRYVLASALPLIHSKSAMPHSEKNRAMMFRLSTARLNAAGACGWSPRVIVEE